MKTWETSDDEDREYFECDCHDGDHVIRATHLKVTGKKDDVFVDEITLKFCVRTGDWERVYGTNKLKNFYRRVEWRIKTAVRILFIGHFELYDEWIPERRYAEQIRGKKELKKFTEWLAKKQIELDEQEMKFRKFSPEELAEYKEFANKWGFHEINDETPKG